MRGRAREIVAEVESILSGALLSNANPKHIPIQNTQ